MRQLGVMEGNARTQFKEWTGQRTPLVIGTNAGSAPLAFQNWRNFKEAFVPELVERAVEETSLALGRDVRTCVDPFGGSGTTPLACQFLGVHPIAIEVNPFLADLIEAKLTIVDTGVVARRCAEVLGTSKKVDPLNYYRNAPRTFVEPGIEGRYLFPFDLAERLASLVDAALRVPELPVRRLLRVLLGSAAMEVCNATVSGKGRRYRKNWQSTQRSPADLDRAFLCAVEKAVFDIARYSRRATLSYDLLLGDARQMLAGISEVDLAVFSPPYPNSFDYTDVYNVELWALGYLCSSSDNQSLRRATLRSHVQIKRDFASKRVVAEVEEVVASLRAAGGLWNKNIPDMIGAYFDDLASILQGIRTKMSAGGRVYMVVGDSRYAGVQVPVGALLTSVAQSLSFDVIGSEPFRSMRASPQQGGRAELPETLVVLKAT